MGEKVWAGYMSTLDKKTRKASEERRKRGKSPLSFCVLQLCRSRADLRGLLGRDAQERGQAGRSGLEGELPQGYGPGARQRQEDRAKTIHPSPVFFQCRLVSEWYAWQGLEAAQLDEDEKLCLQRGTRPLP